MYFLLLFTTFLQIALSLDISQLRDEHRPRELPDSKIAYLAGLSDSSDFNDVLDNILIPRVVGTAGHDKVHDYLVDKLKALGYDVEIDDFTERTPNMGELKFRNIIGRLNPDADRFLVLACHYDSKYFKKEVFLGATDSAVPCAMMLNLASVMKKELESIKNNNDVSLLLLFLDGEEAFQKWDAQDSIYGARHLADKWHRSVSQTRNVGEVNHLQKIDAFVLLDLLGTPNPGFFSYFSETEKLYIRMAEAEKKLAALKKLQNHKNTYFMMRRTPSYVEDDHVPFYIRGVPILHIIPKQFPQVWHTPADNREALDMPTIENLNKILRVFTAEYLRLHVTVNTLTDSDEYRRHGQIPDDEL